MNAKQIGFLVGLIAFLLTVIVPAPAGMPGPAWTVAGLTVLMAAWWMSEAVPLTATALLPFVVLPFARVMTADETAATYYSPILFLILGGAFLALAIERTGLHRRLALAILKGVGKGGGSTRGSPAATCRSRYSGENTSAPVPETARAGLAAIAAPTEGRRPVSRT